MGRSVTGCDGCDGLYDPYPSREIEASNGRLDKDRPKRHKRHTCHAKHWGARHTFSQRAHSDTTWAVIAAQVARERDEAICDAEAAIRDTHAKETG